MISKNSRAPGSHIFTGPWGSVPQTVRNASKNAITIRAADDDDDNATDVGVA